MLPRKIIFILFLVLITFCSHAQDKTVRSDTCLLLLPVKVYYRDNGLHFISDCEVKKFSIVIFDLEGHRKWKTTRLRHDKKSYYIKLRRYRTGQYKWNIKYTMLINGERIVKETFGRAEFLN